MLNLLDVDFWLWYQKVTPKDMTRAFKIKFWDTFNIPGYYNILTKGRYKLPNSNDGCMRLRAPTTCPEWNEGTDKDTKVLHWLSIHAGLTSECVSVVIEPFAKQQVENATTGTMWNKAAKCAATRQVMQPPPRLAKIVEPNTASSSSAFEQYTLLDRLVDVELQSKPLDDAMVINEQAKPVAGSSKHPNNMDVIDGELIY